MATFIAFVVYPVIVGALGVPVAITVKRVPRGALITLAVYLAVVAVGGAAAGYVASGA